MTISDIINNVDALDPDELIDDSVPLEEEDNDDA